MPRPAQFNRAHTLREAMVVFWRQGYGSTSMKDLVTATRLQPGSLYGAFHSKRELFLAALEVYFAETQAFLDGTLGGGGPPRMRLRRFFDELVERTLSDPDHKGCLLVNTLLEAPAEDPAIRQRVNAMFGEIEARLRTVLEEAQSRGELGPHQDPAALAKLLLTGVYGLRVHGKTRPRRDELAAVVDNLLATLA